MAVHVFDSFNGSNVQLVQMLELMASNVWRTGGEWVALLRTKGSLVACVSGSSM